MTDGDIDDAITFGSKSVTVEPDVHKDASFKVTTGTDEDMKSWPISSGVATVELDYNETGSEDEGTDPKGTEITVSVTAENGYDDTDYMYTYYRSNPVGIRWSRATFWSKILRPAKSRRTSVRSTSSRSMSRKLPRN